MTPWNTKALTSSAPMGHKAQELKSQIDKTDKEIDQMVYELYGLTEEGIEVVESNS
ncbi:MAG: hypothetical protein WD048_15135 [Chitinophagales bacterium]